MLQYLLESVVQLLCRPGFLANFARLEFLAEAWEAVKAKAASFAGMLQKKIDVI